MLTSVATCFTFNGNSTVKRRRVPCDRGAVLANRRAFDILRRVGHIWLQVRGGVKRREGRNKKRGKSVFPRARFLFNQQELSKSKHVEAHS